MDPNPNTHLTANPQSAPPRDLAPARGAGEAVIETRNLVKIYGKILALKGVSLTVNRGEIFGLLGQNGAGKTTLIKILLGITSATEGHARLLGDEAGSAGARRRIGYLPEDHRFPEYHTAASLLSFYADLLEANVSQARMDEVLDIVRLRERKDYKIRTYSKGMKQRLGIAQALVHDPDMVFLDEPTDGVDPVGRREIRDLLTDLKQQGKTIFVNSHLLGEVELICDRVAILQRGTVIRSGTVESLTRQKGMFLIGLAPGETIPEADIKGLGYEINPKDDGRWEILLHDGQSIDPVVSMISQKGLKLRHLVEKRQSLEDLFLQTVEESEPGVDAPAKKRERPARARRRYDD